MSEEITGEMLSSLGFVDAGLGRFYRDFGDGYRLQLIEFDDGWGVQVWNGIEDVMSRASFKRLATRLDQVRMLLELEGEIPF